MNLPQETSNTTTAETGTETASPNGVLFHSFAVRNTLRGLFVFDHRIANINVDHNAYFNQRKGICECNFLQGQTYSFIHSLSIEE